MQTKLAGSPKNIVCYKSSTNITQKDEYVGELSTKNRI